VQWQHVLSIAQSADAIDVQQRNSPLPVGHCINCGRLQERLQIASETLHSCELQFAYHTHVYAPPHLWHAKRLATEEVIRLKRALDKHHRDCHEGGVE
jgi:hypothetical protein